MWHYAFSEQGGRAEIRLVCMLQTGNSETKLLKLADVRWWLHLILLSCLTCMHDGGVCCLLLGCRAITG